MKRFLVLAFALSLGACAQLRAIQSTYTAVSTATVSPQVAIVAANSFDAIQVTATNYLVYCRANLTVPACSASNRRKVIKYTRVGRAARNQLELSIASNATAPASVYNALIAAVNQLNTTPVANGVPQ